jgi:hypothetical protein
MSVFGTVDSKDYTIEVTSATAPISWQLVSSSAGIDIVLPENLQDAVEISLATNDPLTTVANIDTGINEYILYRSIKHLFYNTNIFINNGMASTTSPAPLSDSSYVVSVGQSFYGEKIRPGSFEIELDGVATTILDDGVGNLFVSESGAGYYVGNVFYLQGIAVIKHDTGSITSAVSQNGLKIIEDTTIFLDYDSQVRLDRHQINVRINPSEFNYSVFNPSMERYYVTDDTEFAQQMQENNIPSSGSNSWQLFKLMGGNIIKPYITTIGLYNDRYELLAVAKVSTPIQRTFDVDQIFIVRFDV